MTIIPLVDVPSQMLELLRTVGKTIQSIRYERLKGQLLQGVNPEINTDREVLISRMHQLGFRGEILGALTEVDRKVLAASTPLDFKGCVGDLRTLFEEIVEDAAKRAANLTNTTPPSGPLKSDFKPWKDLLVRTKVLTEEEADLFQKLYNYLSNVGTHRLGSGQEHVRIAKNTVIEFGLLLVGRVQSLV